MTHSHESKKPSQGRSISEVAMGLLDSISPTPRNRILGLLADATQGVNDFASKPFGYDNPPARMLMGLLGVPSIATTLDRLSYGVPLK